MLKAFQTGDKYFLQKILSVKPLIRDADIDNAYKSILNAIRERINEVDEIAGELKTEENLYNEYDIGEVYDLVQEKLNVSLINLLPDYFQSLRNQAAQSIRNLSVNVFNTFNDAQVALDIISYALEFDIDGLTKQKLTNDFHQLKELHDERLEQEKHEPILQKYAALLIEIRKMLEGANSKEIIPSIIISWVNANISISELNSLAPVFDEIRNQLALGLRGLSVAVWNNFSEINKALTLIHKATSINTNQEVSTNIINVRNQLEELKRKIYLETQNPQQRVANSSSSSNDNSYLILLALAVGIGIIIFISSEDSSNNNQNPNYSSEFSEPNKLPDDKVIENLPPKLDSKYKRNHLKDGESPYNNYFGKGIYNKSHNNWIEFQNGNTYDAVVCLVDINTGRTIRNEYITAGSTFKMTNIPNGTYYIKSFYGRDWNPEKLLNNGKIKGGFDTDFHFSKSDGYNDLLYLNDNGYQYSTYSVTLYSVSNGNMSQQNISENEFF